MLLLLGSSLLFLSGCRSKCKEGSKDYPACLGTGAVKKNLPVVTLTFWNLFDDKKVFQGAIERFEKKPRQNLKVKIEYKVFTNEEKYEEILIDKIAERGGPDMFALHHSWLPRHQQKIEPIPENLMVPEEYRNTFYDVTTKTLIRKDPNMDNLERIYGLPLFVDTLGLYYNKKIFKILTKKAKPAGTWEEIKSQVVEIKQPDNSELERFKRTGIAMGRSDNIRHAVDILSLLFLQNDVSIIDDSLREVAINRGGNAKEAIELYNSFQVGSTSVQENWNQFITGLYPKEKELGAFVRGKAGMIFGYSTMLEELKDLAEKHKKSGDKDTINISDIYATEVPQYLSKDERDENDFPMNLADFYPLAVSKNSEYSDLAWEFLHEISIDQEVFLPYYFEQTHKPTAIIEGISDAQKRDKMYGPFARQVQTSHILQELNKWDYEYFLKQAITKSRKKGVQYVLNILDSQFTCLLMQINGKSKPLDKNCRTVSK